MTSPDEMVTHVFTGLLRGALAREDLTVRGLSTWLRQSTIGLYHHFGSLDGFLIRVDGAAWRYLLTRLQSRKASGASVEELGLAYIDFARKHAALYWLMAERPFDRAALRAAGRLRQERALVEAFGALLGSKKGAAAEREALLVFAALHGLSSLAVGGRLDLGSGRDASRRLRDAVHDLFASRRLGRR